MGKSVVDRIKDSLDVSGAFDNCFFHTYIIHLLANDMPLPEDLFTFKSIAGEGSPASRLQKKFPDIDSLNLFAQYSAITDNLTISPDFIFEKSLILGFLMREWFATQMAKDHVRINATQEMAVTSFQEYETIIRPLQIEIKQANGAVQDALSNQPDTVAQKLQEAEVAQENLQSMEENLLLGAQGALYAANKDFLQYFTTRLKSEALTQQEENFEKYFIEAKNDSQKAIAAYWEKEGYSNYCKYIGTPRTKVTLDDVTPVIQMLKQPINIYSRRAGTIYTQINGDKEIPVMEVTLDSGAGHYHLLGTDKTDAVLKQYKDSYELYTTIREEVLARLGAIEEDVVLKIADTAPSLLVTAIIRPENISKDPFDLLLEKVDYLQSEVARQRHQQQHVLDGLQEEPEPLPEPRIGEQGQPDLADAEEAKRLQAQIDAEEIQRQQQEEADAKVAQQLQKQLDGVSPALEPHHDAEEQRKALEAQRLAQELADAEEAKRLEQELVDTEETRRLEQEQVDAQEAKRLQALFDADETQRLKQVKTDAETAVHLQQQLNTDGPDLAEEQRLQQEAEAQRLQQAEAKRQQEAQAEAKRQQEAQAEAKRQQEAEAKRQQEAQAEAKRQQEAQAEAKRQQEAQAEAKRQQEAQAEAKRQQEAQAQQVNQILTGINTSLLQLEQRINSEEAHHPNGEAFNASQGLVNKLKTAFETLEKQIKESNTPKSHIAAFKILVEQEISAARPILAKEIGLWNAFKDFLKSVSNFFAPIHRQGFFAPNDFNSAKREKAISSVEDAKKEIDDAVATITPKM